jgi:hypothetical protein
MDIARTWSGGSGGRSWSMEQRQAMPPPYYDGHAQPVPGADNSPSRNNTNGSLPRPQIVKRDTSHQNENVETKHSVKRAALNRDNSLASNRLKQEYMPEYYNEKVNDTVMRRLSANLEQSTLVDANRKETSKPQSLTETSRVSTFDVISRDLMSKPEPLLASDRISTIDALDLDLEVDPIVDQQGIKQTYEVELNDDMPKPKAMTSDNRITTNEFLDIVNTSMDLEGDDPLELDKNEEGPPPLNQETIAENWLTQQ